MNIVFSKKREEMDVKYIHAYLTESYWNEGISLEKVQKCVDNSLNFGLFDDGKQIGYARVLTDFVRFSYLMDVFIAEEHRGKCYSSILIDNMMKEPQLQNIKIWRLATKDAHFLYRKFGFNELANPEKLMEKIIT